jgi:hypothetical protein
MMALGLSMLLKAAGTKEILTVLRPGSAGLPLVCLLVLTGIGAVFLPRVNAGVTEVFTVLRQADGATVTLIPLQPTGSNIGQYVRFLLSGLAFMVTAVALFRFADARSVRRALIVATFVNIFLALIDLAGLALGINFLEPFRNAYVAILDSQVLLGLPRLIAGFPEPSAFGQYTLGLYGFWLRIWFGAPKSALSNIVLLTLVLLLIRSTSTAAYIGMTAYTLLFLIWQLRAVARKGNAVILYAVLTFLLPLVLGLVVLAYNFVPALSDFLNTIVFEKLDSDSGNERMSWNMQSLKNLVDTYGLGAGIGSGRASGWPFAVLGSLGAFGTALYLWFLGSVFFARIVPRRAAPETVEIVSGLQSGCAAVLLLAFTTIPQPNLGLPFFSMAGMVTGLWLQHRRSNPETRPGDPRARPRIRLRRA